MTIRRIDHGKGHSYKIDNRKALGVTTVIKEAIPPKLGPWAARMVAEYVAKNRDHVRELLDWMANDQLVDALKGVPWTESGDAATKGTDVHAMLVPIFAGEAVEPPEALRGYAESAVAFMDEWGVKPVLSEVVVANRRWGYCGTLDFVGELPSGEVVVGDYKSGKGVYDEVALQLAAYKHAEVHLGPDGKSEVPMPATSDRAMVVQIRQDGYEVWECNVSDYAFDVFCDAIRFLRMKDRLPSLRTGPVSVEEWGQGG